ncbi:excinuclease ABC subunit UvrC [Oligoflexus tunisiensis]|uniref:excinuclease ABC subunit UvrC n=1 Tax=Oligoflexus tunisiensis TaxID=708132 RepID=UPI000A838168|nr:excinuclease ABC subunit UvrC [Oligoflexus tunisiensis]
MTQLAEKLKQLPQDSGVYLMKDQKGTIIYVGKAKNLKNRVSSYFQSGGQHTHKTRALVSEIADLDLMLTKTEVEALLLERTLIRHHAPRYNILLRDDKEYPYIRVHFDDPWPRLEKVRRRKEDGAHYIGPFGSSSRLSMLLKQVYRIFPLIRCSPHELKAAPRPCNYYHMKLCLGPCTRPVERDHYISIMRGAVSLLEGNVGDLKKDLEKKMRQAAVAEKYEQAAQFRDQIQAIESITQTQVAILDQTVDADILGLVEAPGFLSFQVSTVRNRALLGGDSFITKDSVSSLQEALESFILQYYSNRLVPTLILLRETDGISDGLASVITQNQDTKTEIRKARSKEELDILELTEKNARHQWEQSSYLNDQSQVALQLLQETLDLKNTPRRIECIDISNLQGTAIVASDVCFIDGKAAKNFYRRYEIKTVVGAPDDFASIREVMERRLERGIRDDDLPDLMIIDGGKPQVRAAMDVLERFPQLGLPLVGLAKARIDKGLRDDSAAVRYSKERLVLPDREDPIELEEGTPVFRLVTRIRDEAHRFAITYHRKKRQKISHASVLDDIAGVGPTLKTRLLQEFGSLEALRSSSLERLLHVKGVSEKVAMNIYTALNAEDSESKSGS